MDGDAVCILKGQRNGLTSLAYSSDGTKLFSGSRMDPEILCWDLRNPGQVLNVLPRVMDTNQRIRISVSVDGQFLLSGDPTKFFYENVMNRYCFLNPTIFIHLSTITTIFVVSGGTDGIVRVWKLDEVAQLPGTCEPHLKFKAHNDCVNGVRYIFIVQYNFNVIHTLSQIWVTCSLFKLPVPIIIFIIIIILLNSIFVFVFTA